MMGSACSTRSQIILHILVFLLPLKENIYFPCSVSNSTSSTTTSVSSVNHSPHQLTEIESPWT